MRGSEKSFLNAASSIPMRPAFGSDDVAPAGAVHHPRGVGGALTWLDRPTCCKELPPRRPTGGARAVQMAPGPRPVWHSRQAGRHRGNRRGAPNSSWPLRKSAASWGKPAPNAITGSSLWLIRCSATMSAPKSSSIRYCTSSIRMAAATPRAWCEWVVNRIHRTPLEKAGIS